METEFIIQHGGVIYIPTVQDGVKLTTERKNTPGKLTFKVLNDDVLDFTEGDPVRFTVDGAKMFYGFVFTKSRSKDGAISVTAYDQLRYLKNKDTFTAEGLKASELIKRLAKDFNLNTGTIEDTGYSIGAIVEENQTLFDIIGNALDETLLNTGKLFVLYDDCGELTLKNIASMKLDLLIDAETAGDFSYSSSIDSQTYNKIKLSYNNDKTGKREIFTAKDSEAINQFGVLQYFEEVKTQTGAAAKAESLLRLYDRRTRSLTVKNAFGDPRVRAGCQIAVNLNLGDIIVKNFMVVEQVTHSFSGGLHTMDLTLIGGDFIA